MSNEGNESPPALRAYRITQKIDGTHVDLGVYVGRTAGEAKAACARIRYRSGVNNPWRGLAARRAHDADAQFALDQHQRKGQSHG